MNRRGFLGGCLSAPVVIAGAAIVPPVLFASARSDVLGAWIGIGGDLVICDRFPSPAEAKLAKMGIIVDEESVARAIEAGKRDKFLTQRTMA